MNQQRFLIKQVFHSVSLCSNLMYTKLNSKSYVLTQRKKRFLKPLFLVLSALSEDSVEAKILADRDKVNEGKERGH